jgi:hypothetical protein
MRNRAFGVVALGRFLAVERYRETQAPSSTHPLWSPTVGRTPGQVDKPDPASGSRRVSG